MHSNPFLKFGLISFTVLLFLFFSLPVSAGTANNVSTIPCTGGQENMCFSTTAVGTTDCPSPGSDPCMTVCKDSTYKYGPGTAGGSGWMDCVDPNTRQSVANGASGMCAWESIGSCSQDGQVFNVPGTAYCSPGWGCVYDKTNTLSRTCQDGYTATTSCSYKKRVSSAWPDQAECTLTTPSCAGHECSSTNLSLCTNQYDCQTNGNANWCQTNASTYACQNTACATCSSNTLTACYSYTACTTAGGEWNSSSQSCGPKPCSSSNLSACTTQATCESNNGIWSSTSTCLSNTQTNCTQAGKYWCNNTCQNTSCTPTSTCNSSTVYNCTSESTCTIAGGKWCPNAPTSAGASTSGVCGLQSSTCQTYSCSSTSLSYCYDQTNCSNVGGKWCPATTTTSGNATSTTAAYCTTTSSICPTTGTNCSNANLSSCTTVDSCTNASGYWCASNSMCYTSASSCPTSGTCTASNFGNCTTNTACSTVGGYWCYNNSVCYAQSNSAACPSGGGCTSTNKAGCTNEASCTNVNGLWCPGTSTTNSYCDTAGSICTTIGMCGNGTCDKGEGSEYGAIMCSQDCTGTSSCSANNFSMCTDSTSCATVNGKWCSNPPTSAPMYGPNGYCTNTTTQCPDYTCKTGNYSYCQDDSSCTTAGGQWCNNPPTSMSNYGSTGYCNTKPFQCPDYSCTSSNVYYCTTETDCENKNGNWCKSGPSSNYYCTTTECPVCTATNTGNCYTESECTTVGANWCTSSGGGYCQTGTCPVCNSTNKYACATEQSCKNVNGNWCASPGGMFNCTDSICPVCDAQHLWNCYTSASCEQSGGQWQSNTGNNMGYCAQKTSSTSNTLPSSVCGNNICESTENKINCPEDCKIPQFECGNQICEGNERATCASDCELIPVCTSNYSSVEQKRTECNLQGKTLIHTLDSQGCSVFTCSEEQSCKREVSSQEVLDNCTLQAGEYLVKRDSQECIVFEECIIPQATIEVYVEPPQEIMTTTDAISIALKLERLLVLFDKLARDSRGLAQYYSSVGHEVNADRFNYVAEMFQNARDRINQNKDLLRDNATHLSIELLTEIKTNIAFIKERMLPQLLYLLLTPDEKVEQLITETQSLFEITPIQTNPVNETSNIIESDNGPEPETEPENEPETETTTSTETETNQETETTSNESNPQTETTELQ